MQNGLHAQDDYLSLSKRLPPKYWNEDVLGSIINNLRVHLITTVQKWQVSYWNNRCWSRIDQFDGKELAVDFAGNFQINDYQFTFHKLPKKRRV